MKLKFKTEPWKHQVEALKYLYKRDVAALYTDMGTGKTKICIDLIKNRGFKRVLVVAPKKACDVWESEIYTHGYKKDFKVVNLVGLPVEEKVSKLKKVLQDKGLKDRYPDKSIVILINYESVWRAPLDKYLLRKTVGIDTVICDESHKIKSPGSKCSKYLALLGKHVQHRYLVTGTPLAENPLDVYAQYRFLDPTIFGTNFSKFCEEYQNLDPVLSSRIGHPIPNKKNPYKNLDKLEEKMFSLAFCAKSSIRLPKTHNKVVKFQISDTARKAYIDIIKEGIVETDKGVLDVSSVISRILREQQITSGFIPVEDDEGNTKIKVLDKNRMICLYGLIKRKIPSDEPVVIFAKFKQDIKNIKKVCRKLGVTVSELSGSKDTLKEWKEGKTKVLIVQYSSGSEAISLVRAKYCIYYSLTHSLSQYTQSKKRIHRPKQNRECTYYHIVAEETIDEHIQTAQRHKKDIVDLIMKSRLSK